MEFKYSNAEEYFSKYIDIFSTLYMPYDNWLAPREKEFLIAHMLMYMEGIPLHSRQAAKRLRDDNKFLHRSVSIYRTKLREKGWIIYTATAIELPPSLKFKKIPKELKLEFKLIYDDLQKNNRSDK